MIGLPLLRNLICTIHLCICCAVLTCKDTAALGATGIERGTQADQLQFWGIDLRKSFTELSSGHVVLAGIFELADNQVIARLSVGLGDGTIPVVYDINLNKAQLMRASRDPKSPGNYLAPSGSVNGKTGGVLNLQLTPTKRIVVVDHPLGSELERCNYPIRSEYELQELGSAGSWIVKKGIYIISLLRPRFPFALSGYCPVKDNQFGDINEKESIVAISTASAMFRLADGSFITQSHSADMDLVVRLDGSLASKFTPNSIQYVDSADYNRLLTSVGLISLQEHFLNMMKLQQKAQ